MKTNRLAVAATLVAVLMFSSGCGDNTPKAKKPSLQSSDPNTRIQAIDNLEAKYGKKAK